MRLAVLSDMHGNPIALDAVLADVAGQGGVDEYLVLGDLVALGYDPITVLQRLTSLPKVGFNRGNTDRYVVTGNRPAITDQEAVIEMANSFSWTQGYVTAGGWFDWLGALPLEQRRALPDGSRLLAVHAAPGTDDGPGVNPEQSDTELLQLVTDIDADLVFVGHTHWPLDLTAGRVRIVNVGSVSNPWAPDLRASYALVEAGPSGWSVHLRRVDYDRQAVIDAIHGAHHPTPGFLIGWFRGERRPSWQRG